MSGLLGIGGGVVVVPGLVYLLHLSQRQAHGTSLVAILLTAVTGAWYYGAHGKVDWIVGIEMAFGGVIGAIIGARICAVCSNRRLRQFFGIFLILIGLRMIADWIINGNHIGNHVPVIDTTSLVGSLLVLLTGLVTGILSGLLGIGGGVIMIPILVLLLGFSQKLAQGISLAVIVPVSISGSLMHYVQGNVRLRTAIWVAIGGFIGSLTGAKLAIGAEEVVLRATFGLLMLVFGAGMVRSQQRKT